MNRRTPRLAIRLLTVLVPGPKAESLTGDLIEGYERGRSRMWLWRQVVKTVVQRWSHDARWVAALPVAILAAAVVMRIGGVVVGQFAVRGDFRYLWIPTGLTLASMAATFVSVGVWVAPSRKSSVGRIGFSVVMVGATALIAFGALIARGDAATPMVLGGFTLLGGICGYFPLRHQGVAEEAGGAA